jgi:hypothetical protein
MGNASMLEQDASEDEILEDYPALNRDLLSTRQSLRPGTSAQMTSPLHVRHREPWRKAILREFAR